MTPNPTDTVAPPSKPPDPPLMDSIMEDSTPQIQSFRDVLADNNTHLNNCYYKKDQISPILMDNWDDPILLTAAESRESTKPICDCKAERKKNLVSVP